jgi:hypothetical protein
MIVTCVAARGAGLPNPYLDARANRGNETVFPLTIGRDYVVYALSARDRSVWYYVHDDEDLPYPMAYPAPLFQVLSGAVPSVWCVSLDLEGDHVELFLGPRSWIADPFFYDRLTSGNADAARLFAEVKGHIEREA